MSEPELEPREVVQEAESPVRRVPLGPGRWFFDFGRAAFGTATLRWPETQPSSRDLIVHLGETLSEENRIDRAPGGTVRYRRLTATLPAGETELRLEIPPDARNTGPAAIPMPDHIGEVMPFRYVELELPTDLPPPAVTRLSAWQPFREDAAGFTCSDPLLNDVWALCAWTIKATTFCGLYVDGDRERIPYEADAYLNQLSHYCLENDYGTARRTFRQLMAHPTWPTEWQFQTIFMAWADYLHTGDLSLVAEHYDALKHRLLLPLARVDGLLVTHDVPAELLANLGLDQLRDIVDWPASGFGGPDVPGERDGYDMRPVNTVVNAFHYEALNQMNRLARRLGKPEDRDVFRLQAQKVRWSFLQVFLDLDRGCFVDGEGSDHASLHANVAALRFGLVPADLRSSVLAFIRSRGMACSVYFAQYLLEALFAHGDTATAYSLLTATHDRSWAHMLYDLGSTMTLEAWSPRYKPNLDWNHAWGAAPANILPRFVLGVQPQKPGWQRAIIRPQLGPLRQASGTIPTWRGPIHIRAKQQSDAFHLQVETPAELPAHVWLPGDDTPRQHPGGQASYRSGAR